MMALDLMADDPDIFITGYEKLEPGYRPIHDWPDKINLHLSDGRVMSKVRCEEVTGYIT